jgi:hypothetical protein
LHDLQILNRGQQQLSPMHSNLVRLQWKYTGIIHCKWINVYSKSNWGGS